MITPSKLPALVLRDELQLHTKCITHDVIWYNFSASFTSLYNLRPNSQDNFFVENHGIKCIDPMQGEYSNDKNTAWSE